MALTNDMSLPSDDQLSVPQEISLSTPYLKAVAPYMAKHCENVINEFMLRRKEAEDPRATIAIGREVTACGVGFLQSLKKSCAAETGALADCIDQGSSKLYISKCRKEQSVMDKCVLDNLKLERPKLGYFSKPHVHDSPVAAPVRTVRDYKAEAAQVLNELPSDYHLRKDFRKYNDWRYNFVES